MTTVVADDWNVSYTTSTAFDGVQFHAFKGFLASGRPRRGTYYGKMFATREEARAFAFSHGYTVEYFGRPTCWCGLRLSPATRRYIERTGRFEILTRVLPESRAAWMKTMPRDTATPIYKNPERERRV
jgi:hypothetical protein